MVDERPMEKTFLLDLTYESWVCSGRQDGQVGIIYLFGMVGVGKKILLNGINNESPEIRHVFDLDIKVEIIFENIVEKAAKI